MENETALSQPTATPAPISLKFPLALIAIFWAVYLGAAMVGIHMFPLFLTRLGATLLCGLLMSIRWLRAKRFRLRTRWGILALVLAGGVVATMALDHTVLPPIVYMWSLPLIMTLGTLWLAFARNAVPATQLLVLCILIAVGWLPGPLVRMEGLNGDGSNDVYWRFSDSAEEKFLKQLPAPIAAAEQKTSSEAEPLVATKADWVQFRGPAGDSQVPGLKIETDWKNHPPKLLWKNPIGPAWSSMIVVGDRLFTQEQRGEIEAITCYSTDKGEQLWAYDTKDRYEEPLGGVGPRATPAFADGKIYALSARGRLECVDALTGKLVWSVNALKEHQSEMPMWGYSVSPVIVDGKVIVFIGGTKEEALSAYDANSGKPVWTTKAGTQSYASPVVMTIAGQEQVLYLGNTKLVSVEPTTGKVLWEYATTAGNGRPCCQPQLVGNDKLLISFGPDSLIQIAVTHEGDAWSAKEVWTTRDIKPDYSDYLVYDGFIYGFDGNIFCCVDLATGKKKWKQGRYGAGQALLLPEVPAVLVTTEKGELVLLACNPEKHTELAKFQAIEGKSWNHQTICRGKLYVRNAEQMACYELPVVVQEALAAR